MTSSSFSVLTGLSDGPGLETDPIRRFIHSSEEMKVLKTEESKKIKTFILNFIVTRSVFQA